MGRLTRLLSASPAADPELFTCRAFDRLTAWTARRGTPSTFWVLGLVTFTSAFALHDFKARLGCLVPESVVSTASCVLVCIALSTISLAEFAGGWRLCHLRRRQGCCERCGYDLRASPGRCSECGAQAPGAGVKR